MKFAETFSKTHTTLCPLQHGLRLEILGKDLSQGNDSKHPAEIVENWFDHNQVFMISVALRIARFESFTRAFHRAGVKSRRLDRKKILQTSVNLARSSRGLVQPTKTNV